MRHRLPPDALLLATVLFWSFNFTAVKYALDHGFEPLSYSSVRFGVGAAMFAAFTYVREGTIRVRRRDVVLLLGAAALGVWLNQLTFVYSVELTASASTVALLFGTLPIFVALIAFVTGTEQLRLRHWVATVVSFAGVALVASGSGAQIGGALGGILLGLAAAATWAAYTVAIGPLMRRYSPYRISAVVLLAGCVPLFVSSAPQLARQDWDLSALAWTACVYSLLFSLVLTNIMWFTAVERVGAARASLYANLQPFLGALFAVLVLSESLGTLQVVGGIVIAAGILLARRAPPPVGHVD